MDRVGLEVPGFAVDLEHRHGRLLLFVGRLLAGGDSRGMGFDLLDPLGSAFAHGGDAIIELADRLVVDSGGRLLRLQSLDGTIDLLLDCFRCGRSRNTVVVADLDVVRVN